MNEKYKDMLEAMEKFKDAFIAIREYYNDDNLMTLDIFPITEYIKEDFMLYASVIDRQSPPEGSFEERYFFSLLTRNLLFMDEDMEEVFRQIQNMMPDAASFLDYGCGSGIWAQRYQALASIERGIDVQVLLVDKPGIMDFIKNFHIPHRYSNVPILKHNYQILKDFYSSSTILQGDDRPTHDIVLLSEIIHGRNPINAASIVMTAKSMMKPTGIMLIIENRIDPEEYMPMAYQMNTQLSIRAGNGAGIYTEDDIKDLLKAVELTHINTLRINATHNMYICGRIEWESISSKAN